MEVISPRFMKFGHPLLLSDGKKSDYANFLDFIQVGYFINKIRGLCHDSLGMHLTQVVCPLITRT